MQSCFDGSFHAVERVLKLAIESEGGGGRGAQDGQAKNNVNVK
jgi:hypothetical protein